MLLPFEKSQAVLQRLALGMVHANQLKVERQRLLSFLEKHPTLQQEEVEPAEWLKQIVEVSELLVEREPSEYEFSHLSFQGFFAATLLAKPQDKESFQRNARLVLHNWNSPVWRESVLLYTAQLSPKRLDRVIRESCKLGSEASELAAICLKEYPRPEKLTPELLELLQTLDAVAQDSKYQTLEALLKAEKWQEADKEIYRLMITTMGKEAGQWFDREDLLNFPCEDLRTIDSLWVKYSNGHFGFSVQKKIYVECGAKLDGTYPGNKIWEKFGDRIGWRTNGEWLSYDELNPSLSSPQGNFPSGSRGGGDRSGFWLRGGLRAQRVVNCSI